jgi:hypothetical protein
MFNRPVAGVVAGDSKRSFAFEAQSTMREARLDEGKTARSQHRKASWLWLSVSGAAVRGRTLLLRRPEEGQNRATHRQTGKYRLIFFARRPKKGEWSRLQTSPWGHIG